MSFIWRRLYVQLTEEVWFDLASESGTPFGTTSVTKDRWSHLPTVDFKPLSIGP
jgi:hypothetical protein